MAGARRASGQIELAFRMRGGQRKGAGRPPGGPRSSERHKARPAHNHRHPVHVTIRVVADVSSLRSRDMYLQLREATIVTAKREDFRMGVHGNGGGLRDVARLDRALSNSKLRIVPCIEIRDLDVRRGDHGAAGDHIA